MRNFNFVDFKKKFNKFIFGRKIETFKPTALSELQKSTYKNFLYSNKVLSFTLHNLFKSIFPLKNSLKTILIKYKGYTLKKPTITIEECKLYGLTYSASLELKIQLCMKVEQNKQVIYKKHQNIYMCELPLMTNNGSFIINGTERVVVSQLCRAPGAYFFRFQEAGKITYVLEIIPQRGSWLEFFIIKDRNKNDSSFVRIDKKKKIPLSIFLHALKNFSKKTMQNVFHFPYKIFVKNAKFYIKIEKSCKNTLFPFTLRYQKKIFVTKLQFVTSKIDKILLKEKCFFIRKAELLNLVLTKDLIILKTNNFYKKNIFLNEQLLNIFQNNENLTFFVSNTNSTCFQYFDLTEHLKYSSIKSKIIHSTSIKSLQKLSLISIFKILNPDDLPTENVLKKFLYDLFFNKNYYYLSQLGRNKILSTLGINFAIQKELKLNKILNLQRSDIFALVNKLFNLKDYYEHQDDIVCMSTNVNKNTAKFQQSAQLIFDDIDNMSNKRLRHAVELLYMQLYSGLVKIKKITQEKITHFEINKFQPQKMLSATPLIILIKEFFCSSQFSQFMDQNNPLSSITHKRRISLTGPGGLTKEHATIESRDVHLTNYGRICPIETPEGKNIGLVTSLALYVKLDRNGLLKTPYRYLRLRKKKLVYHFLTAQEEEKYKIAQPLMNTKYKIYKIFKYHIACRFFGKFITDISTNIDYVDVSFQQILSIATALIPFVEHNDANRALMGANMQRQAVPLLKQELPFICTGFEGLVAQDSDSILSLNNMSFYKYGDSKKIIFLNYLPSIKVKKFLVNSNIIRLKKFVRSNQNTIIHQKPVYKKIDMFKKNNNVLINCSSFYQNKLALGKNVLVAFIPWFGYNFEDSIVVSDEFVYSDSLTSINIEEFECVVRETKLGDEEITKKLPNTTFQMTRKLDENGIIKEGTFVTSGDILVGKITPIEEARPTAEEKLLKAIFGEKVETVQNTSLFVPSGICGVISKIIILTNDKLLNIEKKNYKVEKLEEIREDVLYTFKLMQFNVIETIFYFLRIYYQTLHNKNFFFSMPFEELREKCGKLSKLIYFLIILLKNSVNFYYSEIKKKISNFFQRVGFGNSIIKVVKIYITTKRMLKVGDKLSGRHGNKGVVAKIVSKTDMPHLQDGTAIEMLLNPLSIPSRMNVGQLFEVQLGLSFMNLNLNEFFKGKFSTINPPFNGATEDIVNNLLLMNKLPITGQLPLIDGNTGDVFKQQVTVGFMYMLKLNHLADDKLHARCVGPYNIITQQPLGGKAHFGGQRFGEMEVWALEAFGAAHLLRELMTIKSDDVAGRVSTFRSLIDGNYNLETFIPESFFVLQKELFSLCFNLIVE